MALKTLYRSDYGDLFLFIAGMIETDAIFIYSFLNQNIQISNTKYLDIWDNQIETQRTNILTLLSHMTMF